MYNQYNKLNNKQISAHFSFSLRNIFAILGLFQAVVRLKTSKCTECSSAIFSFLYRHNPGHFRCVSREFTSEMFKNNQRWSVLPFHRAWRCTKCRKFLVSTNPYRIQYEPSIKVAESSGSPHPLKTSIFPVDLFNHQNSAVIHGMVG